MDTPVIDSLFRTQSFTTPNILLVFGIFLILGVLGAILAHRIKWLPTITAYMLLGATIGPSGSGLISSELLHESVIVIDVALGIILYKLGCEVQLRHLLKSTSIWKESVIEAVITFSIVMASMLLLDGGVLASALIAAIAISSSPAVLVHMAEETQARGPVIYQAKALLTLNNILSFLAFSLLLPFALGKEAFNWIDMVFIPLYRAIGAIGAGSIIALLMNYVDRALNKEDEHFRFALIIGGITITLGLTSMLHVSTLFAALTLGIVTRWLETQRQGLSTIEFSPSSDVFFIVLFVMAGANFHIREIISVGAIALVIALTRVASKMMAVMAGKMVSDQSWKSAFASGLMLSPMGALAIGLAQTLQSFSPSMGHEVLPTVFAMIAILETLGPFAVNFAIRMTGESALYKTAQPPAPKDEEKKPEEQAATPPKEPAATTLP